MCCMFIPLSINQLGEPFPGKLFRKNRRHVSNFHSCVFLIWHSLVQELSSLFLLSIGRIYTILHAVCHAGSTLLLEVVCKTAFYSC